MVEITDLKLGKVDGKYEYLLNPQDNKDFYDAYLIPENIDVNSFKKREVYFITGFRGTGKTSLLRYLIHTMQSNIKYKTIILFKSDIEEEKKLSISKYVNAEYIKVDSDKMGVAQDFKSAWSWFLLDLIAKKIKKYPTSCLKDDNYEKFMSLMGMNEKETYKKVLGFLPKIEGAKVKISADLALFRTQVDLDFEKETSTVATALFSDVVGAAIEAILQLKLEEKIIIGVDELEVFFINQEQYNRDLCMVRDLIFAIDRINNKLSSNNIPIYFIAAIRREVVNAIGTLGQEVNRVVHDKGVSLSWHYSQRSLNHPLIQMIRRKISYSLGKKYTGDPIYDFFDSQIDGENLDVYLLDRSFYRPRDIIWRLTLAQKAHPHSEKFTSSIFRQTESEYSHKLWNEIEYELSASFSKLEISAITSIFSGIKRVFYLRDLYEIAEKKSFYSENISYFLRKNKLADVCNILYSHGALGNEFRTSSTGSNMCRNHWIFRGDPTLIIDQCMTLNPALRKALSAVDERKRGSRGRHNKYNKRNYYN